MSNRTAINAVAVLVVVGVVGGTAWFKLGRAKSEDSGRAVASAAKRPRMVDLGADKCIPCKKMAPILKELRKHYAGRADIEFIDVWKNPAAKAPYGIRAIPTQIFYDKDGNEVWRHEGFLSREAIVAKFAELGVTNGSGDG